MAIVMRMDHTTQVAMWKRGAANAATTPVAISSAAVTAATNSCLLTIRLIRTNHMRAARCNDIGLAERAELN